MEPSAGVRDALVRFFGTLSSNDVGSFDDVVSTGPGTLIIGTAPDEFVRERERLEFGFRTEGYSVEPHGPTGYEEGSLGWAIDQPTLHLPDGTSIKTRLTAVLHREDRSWKLVHAHFSVGVPDEEVVELQRRWSG